MKRAEIYYVMVLSLLAGLPGCGPIINWGKGNFYQGENRETHSEIVKPYIRSMTIYDQLTTCAMFDVMWLSDAVRTAYSDVHISRQGFNEERRNTFLRRQLEENNHYITFYVLALVDAKLGTPETHWSLFLDVDGKRYQPIETKVVELPYEYQVFFCEKWNRFREPYLLRFGAKDINDQQIITADTKQITLIARSARKEHALTWPVTKLAQAPMVEEVPGEEVLVEEIQVVEPVQLESAPVQLENEPVQESEPAELENVEVRR